MTEILRACFSGHQDFMSEAHWRTHGLLSWPSSQVSLETLLSAVLSLLFLAPEKDPKPLQASISFPCEWESAVRDPVTSDLRKMTSGSGAG